MSEIVRDTKLKGGRGGVFVRVRKTKTDKLKQPT